MITISAPDLLRALALRDLSDPSQGPHAMQPLLAAVVDALRRTWAIRSRTIRHSPVVAVTDNYDHLGYRRDNVTRDVRHTRYISPTTMLRSHTTADIPAVLRNPRYSAGEHDELIVVPGLAYRRDVIDRTHVGEPHQVDLWRLSSGPRLGPDALEQMITTVVEAVLPGARWRTEPRAHPYTTDGRQVDVLVDGDPLELAECGLIAPDVLARAGLDPDRWTGLALGMGLDRALMIRKQIPDIRYLRSPDPRMSHQLLDLEPWREVSMLPPVRRDLSVVLDVGTDDEQLGDRVRAALGPRVSDLESVAVMTRTPYEQLPPAARQRLGLTRDQVNALVRVTLRPLGRTLTDAEANQLRNRVYTAIHVGPRAELI